MILISLSEIAVISFVNDYGSQATAAYGVVNQVVSYVQMPCSEPWYCGFYLRRTVHWRRKHESFEGCH